LGNSLIDGVDIIGQAAHQFPSRIAIKKAQRKGLQVLEEITAHLFERALGNAGHHPVGKALENSIEDERREHHQGNSGKAGQVTRDDIVINGNAHQVGTHQAQNGIQDHKYEYPYQRDFIWF